MKKFLLVFMLLLPGFAAYSYENTYAVIVAVADYKNFSAEKGDLNYTINDAKKFYEFLISSEGGSVPTENIVYLTNASASKASIIVKARMLFSKAKNNDRVIFYFSGHGDRGCFLPYDVDAFGNNLLYFSEIKSIFRCAKCNYKFLFADACFSGSMKDVKTETVQQNIAKESQDVSNMNIAVMMSCSDNETSWESGSIQQGYFTYFLIRGLAGEANRDGSNYVTIQELFYYVYEKVRERVAIMGHTQTPVLFGNFDLKLIVSKIQ